MSTILKLAREVYKKHEEEYYLETIRKTADELERLESENLAIQEKHKEELENVKAKWFDTNEELKELKLKSQRRDEDFDRYLELSSTTPTLLTEEEIDEYLLLSEKLSKGITE